MVNAPLPSLRRRPEDLWDIEQSKYASPNTARYAISPQYCDVHGELKNS